MEHIRTFVEWAMYISACGVAVYVGLLIYMGTSLLITLALEETRFRMKRRIKPALWTAIVVFFTVLLIATTGATCYAYMSFIRMFAADMWIHMEMVVGVLTALLTLWMSCFSKMPLSQSLDSYKEEYLLPCWRR